MEPRMDFGYYEHHDLPSRYWEPQPYEEDMDWLANGSDLWMDDELLPFN